MDLGLTGKRALITGGSKGIGNAIAKRLVAEGARVAICARSGDELDRAVEQLKETGEAWGAPCDVADKAAYERWTEEAVSVLGGADIFVANASALALGGEEEEWRASFEVDLMGAVRGANLLIPHMAVAGGGAMVFIASVAAVETFLAPAAYNTLKASLITYAAQLSQAVGGQNIRVNCVSPGAIEFKGGIWDHVKSNDPELYRATVEKQPSGRLGTPEEVSDAVVFLVSDRGNWITGENLVVDGGYTKRVAF